MRARPRKSSPCPGTPPWTTATVKDPGGVLSCVCGIQIIETVTRPTARATMTSVRIDERSSRIRRAITAAIAAPKHKRKLTYVGPPKLRTWSNSLPVAKLNLPHGNPPKGKRSRTASPATHTLDIHTGPRVRTPTREHSAPTIASGMAQTMVKPSQASKPTTCIQETRTVNQPRPNANPRSAARQPDCFNSA